jgi:hypothetical protein
VIAPTSDDKSWTMPCLERFGDELRELETFENVLSSRAPVSSQDGEHTVDVNPSPGGP